MRRRAISFLCLLLAAGPAARAQEVTSAPGGVLRALDKISGHTTDIEMRTGGATRLGQLEIVMNDCRYPIGNPAGNAFAELSIAEDGERIPLFQGWMIASAPALSALEHPRYDVWVIRCTTS